MYRESIVLGQTWCDQGEINATIQKMREHKFRGENYHIVQRNCNHFSETFATSLILRDALLDQKQHQSLHTFPAYVNRLARLGTSLAGMDVGNTCNVVAEARLAAGLTTTASDNAPAANPGGKKKELTEKQKALLAKLNRSK